MGKTPEQIEARRKELALQGRRMKALIAQGLCPFCGEPTTGVRRAGEDHQAYEVGAVVVKGCGCKIGCGHVARYR